MHLCKVSKIAIFLSTLCKCKGVKLKENTIVFIILSKPISGLPGVTQAGKESASHVGDLVWV